MIFFVRETPNNENGERNGPRSSWIKTRLPDGRVVESVSRDVFDRAVSEAARKLAR